MINASSSSRRRWSWLPSLSVLALLAASTAHAQQYLNGLTKEQCQSKGGRITRWTNTAGTFPEVGVCEVTSAGTGPSSDRRPSRETSDEDDPPLTRSEELSFAKNSERRMAEWIRQGQWSSAAYSAGAASRSYSQIGDEANAARMKALQYKAECKKYQQWAEEAKAKGNFSLAKTNLTTALRYCESILVGQTSAETQLFSPVRELEAESEATKADNACADVAAAIVSGVSDPNLPSWIKHCNANPHKDICRETISMIEKIIGREKMARSPRLSCD